MPNAPIDIIQAADRLAALHELQLLDSAPEAAFDRLTRLALRITDAPIALVSLIDAERQFIKSCAGRPTPREATLSHSFCQHVVAAREALIVADARTHPLLYDNPAIAELNAIAYLGVPLILATGEALGSFCVIDTQPRAWTQQDLATIQDLAAATMTEIELRRDMLLRKQIERLLAGQTRVLEQIAQGVALETTLTAITALLEQELPGTRCSILLLDPNGQRLRHGAAPRLPEAFWRASDGIRIGPNAGSCGTAAYRQETVVVTDIARDPLWAGARELALAHGLRACWSTPILSSARTTLGTFAVYYQEPRAPDQRALELVQNAAHLAGIAIERARVLEELRGSEERFRSLVQHSSDIITILDADGRMRYESPAVERILGYTPEEMLTLNAFDLIHPDDLPHVMERFTAGLQQPGSLVQTEYRARHRDGSWRWMASDSVNHFNTPSIGGFVVNSRDITEQRIAANALRESEERYRTIVATAHEGIWVVDAAAITTYVNQHMADMLGYAVNEMIGCSLYEFMDDAARAEAQAAFERRRRGIKETYDFRFRRKDGTDLWTIISTSPLYDSAGNFSGALGMITDITERKQTEARLAHAAFHDSLTGLPNRALLLERLRSALEQVRHGRATLCGVLFLDLDHFKLINDSLGHLAGDRFLLTVAERLRGCLRTGDTVARMGGDEFVILLPEVRDERAVIEVAERVQQALAEPFVLEGHDVFSAVSIGIAVSTRGIEQPEDLLRDADTALNRAKSTGRMRYEVFDHAMHAQSLARLQRESELRRAIERQQFELHYQPVVLARTGAIVGVEALLRWRHPELGMMPPAQFMSIAEDTGLIIPLGRWVLETACRQVASWHRQGWPITLAVNLSARQFRQKDLSAMITRMITETGLDSRFLKLEITESNVMQDAEASIATLKALKRLGVRISIDDFGTGYSSLSYLKRLPIDTLKIDRSFVHDLNTDPNDAAIASAIIAMAHNLKLQVIAEGVETPEQRAFLEAHHCDMLQGFLFSGPLPAEQLAALLAETFNFAARGQARAGIAAPAAG